MPPLINPGEWFARNRPFLRGVLFGVALTCAGFVVFIVWWLM